MGVHKENQCPFEIVKATTNMLEHFRQLIFQKNSMEKKLKSYKAWCWSLMTSFDPFYNRYHKSYVKSVWKTQEANSISNRKKKHLSKLDLTYKFKIVCPFLISLYSCSKGSTSKILNLSSILIFFLF